MKTAVETPAEWFFNLTQRQTLLIVVEMCKFLAQRGKA